MIDYLKKFNKVGLVFVGVWLLVNIGFWIFASMAGGDGWGLIGWMMVITFPAGLIYILFADLVSWGHLSFVVGIAAYAFTAPMYYYIGKFISRIRFVKTDVTPEQVMQSEPQQEPHSNYSADVSEEAPKKSLFKNIYKIVLLIVLIPLALQLGAWSLAVTGIWDWEASNPPEVLPEGSRTIDFENQKIVEPDGQTASYKLIRCNPSEYDPGFFEREKPCESSMSSIDFKRQTEALRVFEQAGDGVWLGLNPYLLVSDERFQLLKTNMAPFSGYVVVDLAAEEVIESFKAYGVKEAGERELIYIGRTTPQSNDFYEAVYRYGTAESEILGPNADPRM